MTKEKISYTTPKQQLEKLKQQNLIITDETFAETQLDLCGYSNLIKSYREPYTYMHDGKKMYRSGVTFDQIYSLYLLDNNLRSSVMAAMLDLEEHIKEIAADTIASAFGVHPDDYLQFKNYRDKKKSNSKSQFSLGNILNTMRKTLETDKEPIHHYYNKYNLVPPWILFKSIYFSTIVNFINAFKPKEQETMASKLYDSSKLSISSEALRKLMMDTLFICLEYRNLAAHGGRTYNYSCFSKLRTDEIFSESEPIPTISGFNQLLALLDLLKYQRPFNQLQNVLQQEVNRHCTNFPKDATYLGQVLNINIIEQHPVFTTNKSNKYHFDPYCSGIKNIIKIDLEEAIKQGYIPCKKCNHSK